jgi:DNA-binding CsgD family transcriptional regulator
MTDTADPTPSPSTGAPLFTFDTSQVVRSWNKAAERLTGIPADEVVGRHCWEAICGHDDAGGLVCHAGCSFHRLLRERFPVAPTTIVIKTARGAMRRVFVPFVTVHESTLFAAFLLDPPEASDDAAPMPDPEPPPRLTPRQLTVLEMLADGKQARAIAKELYLSEMTVRNHIRAILRELGCSSQLAAVAKARRLRLVTDAGRPGS